MANIIDYLEKNKDVLFIENEFNELDALILARLSYINFEDLLKKTKYRSKRHIINLINDILIEKEKGKLRLRLEEDGKILNLLRHSLRFKDLYIKSYVNSYKIEDVKQFAAVTFLNDSKNYRFMYVSFKGTDGTLTGWHEDFNMAYLDTIPAQLEAIKYLKKIGRFSSYKTIYVGGHSKGGNLAIYSSANIRKNIQKNIKCIYSFDGPGFKNNFFKTQGYLNIKDKIILYTPQSSVIGRLLDSDYKNVIIESKKALLYQHNVYNWQIENNEFIRNEKYSLLSNKIDKLLKESLNKMSFEEKKTFVDELFKIVEELSEDDVINFGTGINEFLKRFKKILKTKSASTQAIIKSVFNLNKEDDKIEYIEPIKNEKSIISKIKEFKNNSFKKGDKKKINEPIDNEEDILKLE